MAIGIFNQFGLSSGFGLNQLRTHQDSIAQSLERLSTGKRINRASDDPSGMVVSTDMRVELHALEKKLEGMEREGAWLGAREGALSVLDDLMVELNGYVVQAANIAGLSEDEQDAIAVSVDSIIDGINHVVNTTTFGGENVLTGFLASDLGVLQDPSTTDSDGNHIAGKRYSVADLKELLFNNPEKAQKVIESASSKVTGARAAIGNRMQSIESERETLLKQFENVSEALSLIEDTDFAYETAELFRSQVLEQATIAAIQVQQQSAERVLDLITPLNTVPPAGLINNPR